MIPLWASTSGGSALQAGSTFILPLGDAGSGAVNTTPTLTGGSGTLTYTRTTSATCWGPTGLLLTVGPGVLRSTYSELTGAIFLGTLTEVARTNSCLQNRDFTNAAWVKTTMTAAKDQVGIDGTANSASSLLATAGNATAAQTVTIAAVNRPFSVYVKRLVGTGNIDLSQDGAAFTTQSVANDGLWHRCTLVASQLNPVLTIRLATNADKIAVDYAMLEDSGGAACIFPLTPIATTVAAVTRNADVPSYPGAGNFNNTVGTAYAEVTLAPGFDAAQAGVFLASDAAAAGLDLFKAAGQATTTIRCFDGTTNVTKSGITDLAAAVPVKVIATWTGATINVGQTSLALASGAFDGTMGDGSKISLGCSGSGTSQACGTIRNLRIWSRVLSAGEIAAL